MERLFAPLIALSLALPATAQEPPADSTGLPGDDFSLAGALDLFKRNIEMEKFEEELNTDSTHVNNLDLDGNGETDYVRVETRREENAVYVVMKVAVSATENQDVAVIAIEKTGEGSATLQIIGDDDLYPPNTFVEPYAEEEKAAPSKGPRASSMLGTFVVVNVWSWRPIPWCFSARYYPYTSPWYYGSYPGWYRPWRPHPWGVWNGWGHHHHMWYRPWNTCRVGRASAFYTPRRTHSMAVRARYKDAHARYAGRPAPKSEARPANNPAKGKSTKPARAKSNKQTPKSKVPGGGGKTRPPRGGK